jgi:Putative zinc-finger
MSARDEHMVDSLGAYALGALDERETQAVAAHLAGCPECRAQADELCELKDALGEVPPETFLDGPPEGGDLLLQRTLRQVRAEKESGLRTRSLLVGAAAVVAVAVALGGGVLLGKGNTPTTVALPAPALTAPPSPVVPGTDHMSGVQGGIRLDVTMTPAVGWVRVNASVSGIPEGQKCKLIVVSKSGQSEVAGTWFVSQKGATAGTNLDGSALIPMDQVASVEVENFDGHRFVSASA